MPCIHAQLAQLGVKSNGCFAVKKSFRKQKDFTVIGVIKSQMSGCHIAREIQARWRDWYIAEHGCRCSRE